MSKKETDKSLQQELEELRSEVNILRSELLRLTEEKKQAEENDFKKSLFLAKMNHEIRTPMNSIVGFAQLLDDPDVDNETKSEFIKIITNSSQYLLDLINDIIDIAKIESNQIEITETLISVTDFLKTIEDNAFLQLDEEDLTEAVLIEVKNKISESHDKVLIDEVHLKQIFVNLIGNAVKLTKEGKITIEAEEKDNMLVFTVKDTGRGIKKEKLPLLFDYFWHINDDLAKTYNGTGLRLTVVNLLVTLLGGTIEVESQEGKGSEFRFTIPAKWGDDDLQTKGNNGKVEIPNLENKTILIVEDDEYSFRLLSLLLKPAKAIVVRESDGEKAVERCKNDNTIDLILMDMMLPKLDGLLASRKIVEIRHIPIIIQTANALHGMRQKVLDAGCADFITKPINKDDLFRKIKKHIG